MRTLLSLCLICMLNLAMGAPNLVVSIKPVHDLVSAVTAGITEPVLLVPVGASPHDYALTPKQSAALASADLIIWIGPDLENFLIKALENHKAHTVTLLDIPGITRYRLRQGAHWGTHTTTTTPPWDPHLWLSPHNAAQIVQTLANTLSKMDPTHQLAYQRNATHTIQRIQQLEKNIKTQIKPIHGKPYIVFHDAYQYFEQVFHTQDLGSITVHPDIPPSAAHLAFITELLKKDNIRCVFSEPQFNTGLVAHIAEQNHIKSGILDPIGDTEKTGVVAYEALLYDMAGNLIACLL